ncbi:hypothetical protein N665_0123s0021 [Sinapis alba]|nr:hypothetical protein N665_0123s0021 [Sinapis alba]
MAQQFLQTLVEQSTVDAENTFIILFGWRIWKMRNKITYKNKRDHIVHVIRAAWMDKKLWDEASRHNPVNTQDEKTKPTSISQPLPQGMEFICIVDACWKSPVDKAGIGWSLYSKECVLKLQRSSSIDATTSPLVTEAMAILLVVQQLNFLGYKKVVILGSRKIGTNINEATPIAKDMLVLSCFNNFCFQWVPRNLVHYADQLANRARSNMHEYIVTWL